MIFYSVCRESSCVGQNSVVSLNNLVLFPCTMSFEGFTLFFSRSPIKQRQGPSLVVSRALAGLQRSRVESTTCTADSGHDLLSLRDSTRHTPLEEYAYMVTLYHGPVVDAIGDHRPRNMVVVGWVLFRQCSNASSIIFHETSYKLYRPGSQYTA
jgi:hypothetical protein